MDIFDYSKFIHFGKDEEDYSHQKHFDYLVIKQNEFWWSDFYFFISSYEKNVLPWVRLDYTWHHPEQFYKMIPKSIIQCNWFFGIDLNPENIRIKAYIDLGADGQAQEPTGSFHAVRGKNFESVNDKNIGNIIDFCSKHLTDSHLMGFMQTFWMPTTERFKSIILKAIVQFGKTKITFKK